MSKETYFDELDRRIDYRAEVSAAGFEVKGKNGDQWQIKCPFEMYHKHGDKHASRTIDVATGKSHCFGCGDSRDFISIQADLQGREVKDVRHELQLKYWPEYKGDKAAAEGYGVAVYAREKGLPEKYLVETWKATDIKAKTPYIKFPYFMPDGTQAKDEAGKDLYDRRMPPGNDPRFKWPGGVKKAYPYGLQLLGVDTEKKRLLIVEGESDTQTLAYLGYTAIGIPGASTNIRENCLPFFKGYEEIYIFREPDTGGRSLMLHAGKTLYEAGHVIKVVEMTSDAKDVSEVFKKAGFLKDKAKAAIEKLMEDAVSYDDQYLYRLSIGDESIIGKFSRIPTLPPGYLIDAEGLKEEAYDKNGDVKLTLVTPTPMAIKEIYEDKDTGRERIRIEYISHGRVKTITDDRASFKSTSKMTKKADKGLGVDDINAKACIKYLSQCEAIDKNIPYRDSLRRAGWNADHTQFLPTHTSDIAIDIEDEYKSVLAGYEPKGTLEEWISEIGCYRDKYPMRLAMAASFAGALIGILDERGFVLDIWGGSQAGKTAMMKAGLSIWGNPDQIMLTFNMTPVAIERFAGFECDHCIGIDERQSTTLKPEQIDSIVYMLANGIGKARGSIEGVRETLHWRDTVITTGEESLIRNASMDGLATRCLSVYVRSVFGSDKDPGKIHRKTSRIYGVAGKKFMNNLIKPKTQEYVREVFEKTVDLAYDDENFTSGAHATIAAILTLADLLSGVWVFGKDQDTAADESQAFMKSVMQSFKEQAGEGTTDKRALNAILEWIDSERNGSFSADSVKYPKTGDLVGIGENEVCYISPTALREYLEKRGFNMKKTVAYLTENKLIITQKEGDRIRNTIRMPKDTKNGARYYALKFGEIVNYGEENVKTDANGFRSAEGMDNPFEGKMPDGE